MESVSPDRSDRQAIPARRGVAAKARHGQVIKGFNTSGKQVVDTWAFNADDLDEPLSMEHSRVAIMKLVPAVGDTLVTNHRRPILSFVEDKTAGIHDLAVNDMKSPDSHFTITEPRGASDEGRRTDSGIGVVGGSARLLPLPR